MPTATRSQATLAQFNFTSKSLAKKSTPGRDAEASFNARNVDGGGADSDGGGSKYPKRASPPQDDVSIEEESERTAKRLKSTHTEIANVPLSPSPSPSQTTAASSLVVSVDDKVPHLDLKLVPPTPSKGKDRDVLNYSPVDDEDIRMTDIQTPHTPRPLTLPTLPTSPLTPLPPTPLPHHRAPPRQYEEMFVQVKQTDGSLALSLSHDGSLSLSSHDGPHSDGSKTPTNTNASATGSRIPRSSTALTAITAKKGIVSRMRPKTAAGPTSSTTPSSSTPSTASNVSSKPSTLERTPTAPPPRTPSHQRTRTRTISTPGPSASAARARSRSKTPRPNLLELERGRTNPNPNPNSSTSISISTPRTPGRVRTLSESRTPGRGSSNVNVEMDVEVEVRDLSTSGPSTSTVRARSRSKTPGRVDVQRTPSRTRTLSESRTPGRGSLDVEVEVDVRGGGGLNIPGRVAIDRSESSNTQTQARTPSRSRSRAQSEVPKTPGRGRNESEVLIPKTPTRGRSQVPKTPGRVDDLSSSSLTSSSSSSSNTKTPPQHPKSAVVPLSRSRTQSQSQSQDGLANSTSTQASGSGGSGGGVGRSKTPARGSSIPRPKTPSYRVPSVPSLGGGSGSGVSGEGGMERESDVVGGSQVAMDVGMEMEVPLNDSSSQVPSEPSAANPDPQPTLNPYPTPIPASTTHPEPTKKPPQRKRSASVAPGGVRMTRSASLRQQETKKQMDLKDKGKARDKGQGRGRGRGFDNDGVGVPSTAKTRASTVGPPSLPSSSNHASPAKPRPPASSALSRPSSSSTPSTSTSTSTSTSFSSTRPRPPNSVGSIPSSSTMNGGALSTLSMALEKLNMPPPTRPSTSLGFNERRDSSSTTSSEYDIGLGSSTSMDGVSQVGRKRARARDDSTLTKVDKEQGKGKEKEGKGKGKFEFRRATTVGPSSTLSSGSGSGGGMKQTTLMLPPPLPRGTTSTSASTSTGETKKPITTRNGIIGGKGRGGIIFGSGGGGGGGNGKGIAGGGGRGIFGVSALPGSMKIGRALNGIGGVGRVVHRASKVSSLPVVEGSPVKGGGSGGGMDVDGDGDVKMKKEEDEDEEEDGRTDERNPFAPIAGPSTPSHSNDSMDVVVPIRDSPHEGGLTPTIGNGRPSTSTSGVGGGWRGHARRASQAHQILSQTLSTLPQTPPKKKGSVSDGKRRAVDDAETSPSSNTRSRGKDGDGVKVGAGVGIGIGARVSARRAAAAASTSPSSAQKTATSNEKEKEKAKTSTPSGSGSRSGGGGGGSGSKPKTLKILRHCNVYVDVRTDDGDDAGSLFVEMLTGLGARILGRVGQSCTHIVYKNGLVSTLTRYRLLNNPKPAVVGIGWVVECVEQRARVEETGFLIDIEHASIAGSNKRRRSMLPKHLLDSPERRPSGEEVAGPGPVSSPSSEANQSLESLPPLERARRRQSQLFGSRT